jgi:hypothetical protein
LLERGDKDGAVAVVQQYSDAIIKPQFPHFEQLINLYTMIDDVDAVERIVAEILERKLRPSLASIRPLVASLYNRGDSKRAVALLQSVKIKGSAKAFPLVRVAALIGSCDSKPVDWAGVREVLALGFPGDRLDFVASLLEPELYKYFVERGTVGEPFEAMAPIRGLDVRLALSVFQKFWEDGNSTTALELIDMLHKLDKLQDHVWLQLCRQTPDLPNASKLAEILFQAIEKYGVYVSTFGYNCLITAHCKPDPPNAAGALLILAKLMELSPEPTSLSVLIKRFGEANLVTEMCQVWELAHRHKSLLTSDSMFRLFQSLREANQQRKALEIFDQAVPLALSQPRKTPWPNRKTLSTVVGYAMVLGEYQLAEKYWNDLTDPSTFNITPDKSEYVHQLRLCRHLNNPERGFRLVDEVLARQRTQSDFTITNDLARLFVSQILNQSGVVPPAMLGKAFQWIRGLPKDRVSIMSEQHLAEFKTNIDIWRRAFLSRQRPVQ